MRREFLTVAGMLSLAALAYLALGHESSPEGLAPTGEKHATESRPRTATQSREAEGRDTVDVSPAVVTGRVVSDRGQSLQATLEIRPSGSGESTHVTTSSDFRGLFSAPLRDNWRSVSIDVASDDGLWVGSFERDTEPRGLGDLELTFAPLLRVRLLLDEGVRNALDGVGRENLWVRARWPRNKPGPNGTLSFLPGKPQQLLEFTLDRGDQTASARLAKSHTTPEGVASIELGMADARIETRHVNLMVAANRDITFEIDSEMLLAGTATVGGQPADDFALHYMVLTAIRADLVIGSVRTRPDGTFLALVERRSHGTIWPGVLGQSVEVPWQAATPLNVTIDTSELLRVEVVDASGEPLPRGLVTSTPSAEWGQGTDPASCRRLTDGAYFLRRKKLRAGTRLFLRVPSEAERMFVADRDYVGGGEPVVIDFDTLIRADSSLRVVARGRGARASLANLSIDLRRIDASKDSKPMTYYVHPRSAESTHEGLFSGRYAYVVRIGRDVVQSGEIDLPGSSRAPLFLDV